MALTYQISSAPSSMRMHSSTGLIQCDNPVAGSYAITLRADNGITKIVDPFKNTLTYQGNRIKFQ